MKTQQQLDTYVAARLQLSNERLRSNLRGHGIKTAEIAAARKRVSGNAIVSPVIRKMSPAEFVKTASMTAPAMRGTPLADLFKRFDEVAKIKAVMRELPKREVLEDDAMRTRAGVPLKVWNAVKAHKSLAKWRYRLPDQKVVWMHEEAQAELTARINLSETGE
jgi:uncharacterized protein (DUF2336 family)